MKQLLLFLSLLTAFILPAKGQGTLYKVTTKPGSTTVIRKESTPGSATPDLLVSSLPAGAVRVRVGEKVGLQRYVPEANRALNVAQFGTGKFFDPNFKFIVDFNPGKTPVERKALGENMLTVQSVTDAEKAALPFGDGLIYMTDNATHGPIEGYGFFESSLATYEATVYPRLPACGQNGPDKFVSHVVFNIEISPDWWPGNQNQIYPGFTHNGSYAAGAHWEKTWEQAKSVSILCESDGQTRTLEQLANLGQTAWENEKKVRRANRFLVMQQGVKLKSIAGTKVSNGASMFQGEPKLNQHFTTSVFNDGAASGQYLGQNAQKQVTLNGRVYTLSGDQYTNEDFVQNYNYQFFFNLAGQDYQDIWVNQLPGTQNFPYIWSKIKTRHVVAYEKGIWQEERYRMTHRTGQVLRPQIRMVELFYEGREGIGLVDGQYPPAIKRVPAGMGLTGTMDFNDGGPTNDDTPKVWLPPYEVASTYVAWRFLEGSQGGFMVFNSPAKMDLPSMAMYNHALHSVSAIYQARHDLQPYERFLANSTLVENPEVQLQGSSTWSAYDGTTAYGYDGEGGVRQEKPAYSLRYAATANGFRVLILGGMNQGWTQERTDFVRYQFPGMTSPVSFKIKIRGPSAQIFEFGVKTADAGQSFEVLPNAVASLEKPGYYGRVTGGTGGGGGGVVSPPSSSTGAGPSWYTANFSYDAATKRLDIFGDPSPDGETVQLRFERQDGQPLFGSNPDGVAVNSEQFFFSGSLPANRYPFTQQWVFGQSAAAGSGIPQVPLRLTFKKTDGTTFTWEFTPFNGAAGASLFVANTASGGGNSGGNTGGNTGGGTGGGQGFLTYSDQGWPRGTRTKWIENDQIKVGFSGETGAVLTHAILKSTGQDLVNTYIVNDARGDDPLGRQGQAFEDKGRSVMFGSDYFTPGNAWQVTPTKNTRDFYFDTGGNVVQGGSLGNYYDESQVISSAIINDPVRGQVFCAQVRARVWGVPGEFGHIILDEEVWLDGKAICYKARHTVGNRSAQSNLAQVTYQSREQENPCLYVIAPLTNHLTRIGGQEVNRFPTKWNHPDPFQRNNFSNTVFSDACWIGAYGPDGIGVTYYSPMNSAVRSGQFVDVWGDNTSNASSYLNAALAMNYDNPGVYDDYGYIILGSKNEALTKISQLPPIDQSFDFDFTLDNHRWNNYNCRGIREGNTMVYYIGEKNQDQGTFGTIRSPARAWQASNITTLEFDMAVSNATTLWLEWKKPGEENDNSRRFRKAFTGLIPDGQRRTYTISTSDPNFNGIISLIGLTAIRAEEANGQTPTPSNAKITLYRVRKL